MPIAVKWGMFLIDARFNGHWRADGLEDCPICCNWRITDHLTTPVLALDPILVLCFLLHKAVEQLLFKRTYAKDIVTKFSPHQKLEEFFEKKKHIQMTVFILESPLEFSVFHDQRVQHGCLLKLRYLFPPAESFCYQCCWF